VPIGNEELYHIQDFAQITKEDASPFLTQDILPHSTWDETVKQMSREPNKITTLLIPNITWNLFVVLVSKHNFAEIAASVACQHQVHVVLNKMEYIFADENKTVVFKCGVCVSTWVLGDPKVTATRVTYEFVECYKDTFGTGYGSMTRSYCLDSINSYRDKRFNQRVHPSSLF
jgi:hypothetical protein